jgi:predicted XRE-type DNA-binding protein
MKKNKDYFVSSGNVFADLELPNPEERLAKAELALQINRLIKQKKLTQIEAAQFLDIDQPKISLLAQGKLSGFSLERLFKFLNLFGQDITIKVSKARMRKKANVIVDLPKMKKSPAIKRPFDSANTTAIHAKRKK